MSMARVRWRSGCSDRSTPRIGKSGGEGASFGGASAVRVAVAKCSGCGGGCGGSGGGCRGRKPARGGGSAGRRGGVRRGDLAYGRE